MTDNNKKISKSVSKETRLKQQTASRRYYQKNKQKVKERRKANQFKKEIERAEKYKQLLKDNPDLI